MSLFLQILKPFLWKNCSYSLLQIHFQLKNLWKSKDICSWFFLTCYLASKSFINIINNTFINLQVVVLKGNLFISRLFIQLRAMLFPSEARIFIFGPVIWSEDTFKAQFKICGFELDCLHLIDEVDYRALNSNKMS